MGSEAIVREALRAHLLHQIEGVRGTVDEFWVPRSNERADIAVISQRMDGFEIKTDRDTLQRLPRQVAAYGRLFDRCTAVVAERHRPRAEELLPDWWGLMTICAEGSVILTVVRPARRNPSLDPETLVRLLWREEVATALVALGRRPDARSSRASLWAELLRFASLTRLRSVVRDAVVNRDPRRARLPSRRLALAESAAAPGR